MGERDEFLWKCYETINQWIANADTKATVVLAAVGVIVGVVFVNLTSTVAFLKVSAFSSVLCIVAASLFIASAFFSFRCVLPRLKVGEPESALYFRHIAEHSNVDYEKIIRQLVSDPAQMETELMHQIWANATVASRKYRDAAFAIWCFMGACAISLIPILLYTGTLL